MAAFARSRATDSLHSVRGRFDGRVATASTFVTASGCSLAACQVLLLAILYELTADWLEMLKAALGPSLGMDRS